ncbi:MAG: 23S rRNA (pseudouridine(1915)-N(3))-methyltransferase RlmH [Bdellovibrionales bacterium]
MIKLLTIKSSRSKWLELASEEYTQKIGHFFKFELVELPSTKNSREDSYYKIEIEGQSLLSVIKNNDYLILLDERGKAFNSRQWAENIQKLQLYGQSKIVFVIGGAFGTSEALKSRANEIWSLSNLVYNHHVALLVTLEQLYRSGSILNNKPYHNE